MARRDSSCPGQLVTADSWARSVDHTLRPGESESRDRTGSWVGREHPIPVGRACRIGQGKGAGGNIHCHKCHFDLPLHRAVLADLASCAERRRKWPSQLLVILWKDLLGESLPPSPLADIDCMAVGFHMPNAFVCNSHMLTEHALSPCVPRQGSPSPSDCCLENHEWLTKCHQCLCPDCVLNLS